MAIQTQQTTRQTDSPRVPRILVIDSGNESSDAIRQAMPEAAIHMCTVNSVEQAIARNRAAPADVAFINVDLQPSNVASVLMQVRAACPNMKTVAMSRHTDAQVCLNVWRAGAADLVFQPVEPTALQRCMANLGRLDDENSRMAQRNQRLRQMCRRLSQSRQEISDQVNTLCRDMVKAYQELAEQLHQTQDHVEFATQLRGDLEVESLLRKTMAYMLRKIGAVNSAIFLPGDGQRFLLGAYLRHDTDSDDMFLKSMEQTLVARAVETGATLCVSDDAQAQEMFGQNFGMLSGRCWVAAPMRAEGAFMGVMILFRDQRYPLENHVPGAAEAIGGILAAQLNRVVRVHHRGDLSLDDIGDAPDDPGNWLPES